jgi:hypothetical protein
MQYFRLTQRMSNTPIHNPPHEIEFGISERIHAGGRTQAPDRFTPQPPSSLPINDALQIKAAEYWLKLGEADQALRELECLPQNTWNNRAAIKIRIAAIGMLREQAEQVEVL